MCVIAFIALKQSQSCRRRSRNRNASLARCPIARTFRKFKTRFNDACVRRRHRALSPQWKLRYINPNKEQAAFAYLNYLAENLYVFKWLLPCTRIKMLRSNGILRGAMQYVRRRGGVHHIQNFHQYESALCGGGCTSECQYKFKGNRASFRRWYI